MECETLTDTPKVGRVKPNFQKAKGICRECFGPKSERRSLAAFCSDACRAKFHNRAKMEGASIIHVAKRWRRFRKGSDLTLLYKMLGDLIAEDKEIGRDYYPDPPVTAYTKVVGRNIEGRRRR